MCSVLSVLQVSKLQSEIDVESENRAELARQERMVSKPERKTALRDKLHQSDEKIQSLALLMLHYCAGLQHCLDTMEEEKERRLLGNQDGRLDNTEGSGSSRDASPCSRHSGSHDRNSKSDIIDRGKAILLSGTSHSRNNSSDNKEFNKASLSSDSGTHSRNSSLGVKDIAAVASSESKNIPSTSGEAAEDSKVILSPISSTGLVIKVTTDDEPESPVSDLEKTLVKSEDSDEDPLPYHVKTYSNSVLDTIDSF